MEITLTTWGQEEATAAEPGGNGLCGMGMGHAFVLAITFKRRHTPERRDAGHRRGGGGGTGNCFSMQIHIISRQAALFSSVQAPTTTTRAITTIVVGTFAPRPRPPYSLANIIIFSICKFWQHFLFFMALLETSPFAAIDVFFCVSFFYHFVFMFHIFYVLLFYLLWWWRAQTFASDCYRHSSKRFDGCC